MLGVYGILEIYSASASGIYFHLLDCQKQT
jgi:hypothetical protein